MGTQRGQVGIHDLAVDPIEIQSAEVIGQCDEGSLACVGLLSKHGFSEKHAPQRNTVEAAYQFARSIPCFNAVRKTQFVQSDIGLNEIIGDPCSFFRASRATMDDPLKVGVGCDGERFFAQDSTHAFAHFDVFGPQRSAPC